MHYFVHGFYGAGNAGDDAILHALIDELTRIDDEAVITVSVRSKSMRAYFGPQRIHTIFGFDLLQIKNAIAKSDVVIIGGGGLLQDYSGFQALNLFQTNQSYRNQQGAIGYYSTPIFLAKTMGIKVVLYALGIGPFRTAEGRNAAAWIAGLADAVTVRDRASCAFMLEMGVARTELTADPALLLDMGYARPDASAESGGPSRPPKIGINLRRWPYDKTRSERLYAQMAQAAKAWIREHGATIAVLPYNVSMQEVKLAEALAEQLDSDRVEVVRYDMPPIELQRYLGTLDLMVAMRLHASIMAMNGGTLAIGIAYDPKVGQFYEDMQLPELCMRLEEATLEGILGKAEEVLRSPQQFRAKVLGRLQPLRARAELNGRMLRRIAGLEGPVAGVNGSGGRPAPE